MIRNLHLPQDLLRVIDSEPKDFAVLAQRAQPLKNSIGLLIFGLVWLAFTSVFFFIFISPLLAGEEVNFETNGRPVTASMDNLEPLIFPAIIIGIFMLIGIAFIVGATYSIFKKGGYFVGTPTRLIHYVNGRIKSMDWEQFNGNIELSGTSLKGNLSLEMRTGRMVKRKNSPERYVPNVVYMTGIPDVYNVEKFCRRRIKENDPTPSNPGAVSV